MTISLVKGQKIDLTKGNSGLAKITIGLGWDPAEIEVKGFFGKKKGQAQIDCDASALLLDATGKLANDKNLVCFANLKSPDNSVVHSGDNRTGEGEGDDEQINVNLATLPADIHKVLVVVNIYNCEQLKQDFGMIKSAYIRILNSTNNQELMRFNLTEDYKGKTALIVGEIYRYNAEWKFTAIGEGTHAPHISILAKNYK